jgi:glycosyltransferase involved in cell wall biosynthesis
MTVPRLSVVAPCFNEEEVLPEFHQRVSKVCQALGHSYEIVLVNDGSHDHTWQKMIELAAADPALVLVNLSRNYGHQLALTAGLSVCSGEYVLILDADLQDPPELLPRMLGMIRDGADVVYGQRRRRLGESSFKLVTAALFYRLINKLSDTPIPRDTGDFRLLTRRVLDVLRAMPERHRFVRGMVTWIGFRQVPILYDREPRFAGQTKYPFRKMLKFSIDAVTAFSIRPLMLTTWLGLGTACLGLLLILYSLASWLLGRTVTGWTSLMGTMALLSSVQLLVLGIIGEYLGRLYEQMKGRPLFIIDTIVKSPSTRRDAELQTNPAEGLGGSLSSAEIVSSAANSVPNRF